VISVAGETAAAGAWQAVQCCGDVWLGAKQPQNLFAKTFLCMHFSSFFLKGRQEFCRIFLEERKQV
jgi:hypothetical protein